MTSLDVLLKKTPGNSAKFNQQRFDPSLQTYTFFNIFHSTSDTKLFPSLHSHMNLV